MFGNLNEQATSALLSLESGDLSYCLKLAKRFEHMGIEEEQASNALCALVASDALETIYQVGSSVPRPPLRTPPDPFMQLQCAVQRFESVRCLLKKEAGQSEKPD